jgi:hypothetical protein
MSLPIAAILGGASLASQLMSMFNPVNSTSEQVNPYTDQFMQQMQEAYAQNAANVNRYSGEADAARRSLNATGSRMRETERDMGDVQAPGQNDWFVQMLKNMPEYEAIAANTAERFSQNLGRTGAEQARLASAQAVNDTASAFAGNNPYSGAAAGAVSNAALQPQLQAQMANDQMRASMANNTFNNLGGAGQQLSYQANQDQFTNALQQLQQILGAQGSQANLQSNQMQGATSMAQLMAQLQGQAQNGMAQIADPVYQQQKGNDMWGDLSKLFTTGMGFADTFAPSGSPDAGGGDTRDPKPYSGTSAVTVPQQGNFDYTIPLNAQYTVPTQSLGYSSPFMQFDPRNNTQWDW